MCKVCRNKEESPFVTRRFQNYFGILERGTFEPYMAQVLFLVIYLFVICLRSNVFIFELYVICLRPHGAVMRVVCLLPTNSL